MHIIASEFALQAEHQHTELQWQTSRLVNAGGFAALLDPLVQQGASVSGWPAPPGRGGQDESLPVRQRCFRSLIELLFHDRCQQLAHDSPATADPAASAAPPDLSALQVETATVHYESEQCSFSASGSVCLADGSRRQLAVDFRQEREQFSAQFSRRGLLTDPLFLDRADPATPAGAHPCRFDLDADGQAESVSLPSRADVLFLDRNGNGRADDGRELFGVQSGDGFADLAQLDQDHNGWIDEADPDFARLRLWQPADERVQSLAAAGIGALGTRSVATPYRLVQDGDTYGQQRASGVWLGEQGGIGTLRQIDVRSTDT
ncbi:hypothetical protein [Chitinilyticum piscinae]|uniref:Uncharacterized protein n=1 Tax=Chitinilyticum piscinae TaxID=2866724 RepID=A0A8J7FXA0_9NEIS|nr:hypothetical protein [Chitinilyticum piscinae]MBE9608345.1 hypothetical protein [Chitinilyticum piscinae]